MPETEDDALREAAAHRGLKLVKSRKRKVGVGDYGRFALTDGSGKELFGFGDAGLTASPEEIRDYLRKSEMSTWAQSAEVTPDRPPPSIERVPAEPVLHPSIEDDSSSAMPAGTADREDKAKSRGKDAKRKARAPTPRERVDVRRRPPAPEEAKLAPEPEPEPEPVLSIRAATKADLVGISGLIAPGVSATDLATRFNVLRSGGGGVLVADRGGVIGCVAWHAILGLRDAPIGRITLLLVTEDERRRGLGRALLEAASSEMLERGCSTLEAMSDIEVRNLNGFYRAAELREQSYRFVRAMKAVD